METRKSNDLFMSKETEVVCEIEREREFEKSRINFFLYIYTFSTLGKGLNTFVCDFS